MRLLVVEDDQALALAVQGGLVAEGFDVDITHDGLDGLWRVREGHYAAVVLDIMLPEMNGYEVCRTLRQEGNQTPILMLTAKDGDYDQVEGLDYGADDYIVKPVPLMVLVARVRAAIRRAGNDVTASITVGDLVIDPSTRRCHRGSAAIELTHREFSLLEYLAAAAPRVVSKPELLDAVWGIDFDGDINIVESYIRHLRAKIDKPFECESVETVRGFGYRLGGNDAW